MVELLGTAGRIIKVIKNNYFFPKKTVVELLERPNYYSEYGTSKVVRL